MNYQISELVNNIIKFLSLINNIIMEYIFQNFHFSYQYCKSGSVQYGVFVTTIIATICFILTKLTTQYSWVDRIWSILPIGYGVHLLYHQRHCQNEEINQRQFLMIFLISIWGIRLTYNFYRKGGYKKGGQDYRWAFLRERLPWIIMEILNFSFTAYYQLYLIYWFSLPIAFANKNPLNIYDILLAGLYILFLAIEVIADQQQWKFQNQKYRLKSLKNKQNNQNNRVYQIGFITTGLFRYSRHPNFFAEQCLWWIYYLFSVNSIGYNNSGYGALQLSILFNFSTLLTEYISCTKYPLYKQYQKTTSRFILLPAEQFVSSKKE